MFVYLQFLHVSLLWHQTLGQYFEYYPLVNNCSHCRMKMGLLEMAFNPSQINGQQKSLPRVNGFLPQHCVDFLSSENMNKNKSNYKYWLLYYTLCYSSYYLSNKMIFVTRPVKHWTFFMHSQIWWHAGIFESERQSISYLTNMVDVCLNHESL